MPSSLSPLSQRLDSSTYHHHHYYYYSPRTSLSRQTQPKFLLTSTRNNDDEGMVRNY